MEEDPQAEKRKRTRAITALIGALATFLLALTSYIRSHAEPSAKAGQETMTAALADISKATAQNHDDIMALRNFLDGYVKASSSAAAAPPTLVSVTPSASARPPGTPPRPTPTAVVVAQPQPPPSTAPPAPAPQRPTVYDKGELDKSIATKKAANEPAF